MSLPQNKWLQLRLHLGWMQTGHGQGPVPFISFLPKVVRSKRNWCSGQPPWLSLTWPRDSEWEVLVVCMSTMKARQKWVLGDSGNGFCFHLLSSHSLVTKHWIEHDLQPLPCKMAIVNYHPQSMYRSLKKRSSDRGFVSKSAICSVVWQ